MKKMGKLLSIVTLLACSVFAGCSMPSFGSGNSLGDVGGIHGSDLPDDSKDSSGNSTGGSTGEVGGEDKPTDSSKPNNPGDSTGGGNTEDPTIPWIPDDVPEIPAGKIYVDVQYFTIHTQDGMPLRGGYFVDEKATLNEFFAQNNEEIMRDYNEGQGFEEGSYAYDKQFFEESFWQYGSRLMYGEDRFIDFYEANAPADGSGIYFPLFFTPSGAGPNITIYNGEFDSNPLCFPFPISVCLRDTVDWAHNHGMFEMSYNESVKAGVWKEYWSNEPIDGEYSGVTEIIFIRNEDIWDDPDMPKENRFTVYMPTIYDYQYYEDGTPEVGGVKDFSYEFVGYESGVTIEEAKNYACDSTIQYVYYMNGERVDGNVLLTEDSVVVCVVEEADREIPEFTVTISAEGQGAGSYTCRAPVTLWEVAQKYCKEKGLNYSDYVWDCEAVSFQPFQPIVCDRWISAVLYSEPVQPTEAYVSIRRYDGVEETLSTYAVPIGISFEAFVQQNLLPEYTYATAFECEYAFFVAGNGMNEFSYANLEQDYNLWMIKRSVLEQGYNVSVDLTTHDGITETGSRVMYFPATLRSLIWEVTGWELWSLDMYKVTVNGAQIEYGGKEDFWYLTEQKLYYTDMEIVVKPIVKIEVIVEAAGETGKSKTLTYNEDVTTRRVAQDLGLSRDAFDYLWVVGWDSMGQDYVHPDDGLLLRLQSGGYLYVLARKVVVGLYITPAIGMPMNFEPVIDSTSNSGWDWSVSVRTAAEYWIGGASEFGSVDDYNWRVKDEYGERSVTADELLNIRHEANGNTFYARYTYYTLIAMPKKVMVEVVVEENGNRTEISNRDYESGTNIGEILSALGYQRDSESGQYCIKNGIRYNLWIMGYGEGMLPDDLNGRLWEWSTDVNVSIRIILWKMS